MAALGTALTLVWEWTKFSMNKQRQAITFCSKLFKALANILASPKLSFVLTAGGLLLMLRFRRHVFNWWLGFLMILVEGFVVIWGMKDPNFYLIVGKPDKRAITAMLFISTWCCGWHGPGGE